MDVRINLKLEFMSPGLMEKLVNKGLIISICPRNYFTDIKEGEIKVKKIYSCSKGSGLIAFIMFLPIKLQKIVLKPTPIMRTGF